MLRFRFSVCGYVIAGQRHADTFEKLRNAGFSGIEGNDLFVPDSDRPAAERLSRAARAAGVPFTSYHLPFTKRHDVSAFYETDRLEAVRLIEEAMTRASWLGSDIVILHPTTNSSDVHVEGTDRYMSRLCRSLEPLAKAAERLGLRIAVENMMNSERTCFFSQPEHIASFRKAFNHEHVSFCLDTGHALISVGAERQHEIMEAMGGKLIGFHLQDTPGDRDIHIAPGHGNVDFHGVFKRIKEAGIDEVMCIECPPFAPERPYTPDAWDTLVRETQAMVSE